MKAGCYLMSCGRVELGEAGGRGWHELGWACSVLARASGRFEATLPYLCEGQAVRDADVDVDAGDVEVVVDGESGLLAYTSHNNTAACKDPVGTARKKKVVSR